jgi:hypothetical protein
MKLLILDTRRGAHSADLFILEKGASKINKIKLGYVPEFHYDQTKHQIVIVETELRKDDLFATKHWLKCLSADNLEVILQKEIPERPMYSGYPGRSTRVKSSSSGRFLYFLESTMHPTAIEVYRIKVHRYDYEKDEIQAGQMNIDSCLVDFDQVGENEDELYFHLSCEFPSVVAFGNFNSPEIEFLQLEKLPSRTHGPKETCGSWFSKNNDALYCINGEGSVYAVNTSSKSVQVLVRLLLEKGNSIPLHQVYGTDNNLLIGISENVGERGLSLASQIWRIDNISGELLDKIQLPFPVMNFIITPDNQIIIGVSPFQRSVVLVELKSGRILGIKDEIGVSPAEVFAIP